MINPEKDRHGIDFCTLVDYEMMRAMQVVGKSANVEVIPLAQEGQLYTNTL